MPLVAYFPVKDIADPMTISPQLAANALSDISIAPPASTLVIRVAFFI